MDGGHADPATTLEMSAEIGELAAALAAAQAEFTAVPKGRTAKVQTRAGGEYTYSYADLSDVIDMVRPVLAKHGLSVVQLPAPASPHEVALRTMLLHKSGQWIAGVGTMPCDTSKPQAVGSAITYLRMYQLCPMLGIVADIDDDAQSAGHATHGRHASHGQRAASQGQRRTREPGEDDDRGSRQHGGPPRSGKALFAWARTQEDNGHAGTIRWLNEWAKHNGVGGRMVEWSDADVSRAYAAITTPAEAN